MATVVPMKGTNGSFGLDKILGFVRQCGDESTDITIKTDQKPAIKVAIKELVKARMKDRTQKENESKVAAAMEWGKKGAGDRGPATDYSISAGG